MDESYAVAAEAENARGGAEAKVTYWANRYILALTWKAIGYPDGEEFYMVLARSGPKEEITDFIEEWLLKFPDPDLVSEALEKCNAKLPEGIRLF